MPLSSPAERPSSLIQSLLSVWEASVRATHHFLSEKDILSLVPLVDAGLRAIPSLYVISGTSGEPQGFLGMEATKIEMLFIHPDTRGQGLGRQLVEHAVRHLGADSVDVNEQNVQGVGFYIHMGFEVVSRSAVDGQGNPFPLLHMKRGVPREPAPDGYAIRHAEPGHLALLNDIERAAATLFSRDDLPEAMLDDAVPLPVLREAMERARLWVALDGEGKPVGYALLQIQDGEALLAQMDVHPAHGRHGLGSALIRRVARAARGMGLPNLYLTTFVNVPWNGPFYAKNGFQYLEPGDEPTFLQHILEEERAYGLSNRTAMKLSTST